MSSTQTITSRAALIRALTPGTIVTMIAHDWSPNSWMIGVPRPITRQQTQKVALRTERPDGSVVDSWMDIPTAADLRINDDGTFSVRLSPDDDLWMTYRLEVAA